ncbi:MAG: hypothetical protein HY716_16000 [Planctomycetes bacterium]|nr:hypothetical protein [Planctomycetota bacterium]
MLLLAAQDAGEIRVFPGEPGEKTWPIYGSADLPDQAEVRLVARRMERRWQAAAGRFAEYPSEKTARSAAAVNAKTFQLFLRPGCPGRYVLALSQEETRLRTVQAALGPIGRLFGDSCAAARKLVASIDKAAEFLEEIEETARRPEAPEGTRRDDFLRRVTSEERALERAYDACDLTGTIHFVWRDIYYQIRNAQVWDRADRPSAAEADNDPADRKGYFLDDRLTLDMLRKKIASAKTVLSLEMRLSVAVLLEDLFARADQDPKRVEGARAAAREAGKFLAAAPEPDARFAALIESAASEEGNAGDLCPALRAHAERYLSPP